MSTIKNFAVGCSLDITIVAKNLLDFLDIGC